MVNPLVPVVIRAKCIVQKITRTFCPLLFFFVEKSNFDWLNSESYIVSFLMSDMV